MIPLKDEAAKIVAKNEAPAGKATPSEEREEALRPSPLGSAIPGVIMMAAVPLALQPHEAWTGDVESAPGDAAFGTWDSTFGGAAPGEVARLTALVVWSSDSVHGLQVRGELADGLGGLRQVASPEPPGVEPRHRREIVLEPGEFVTCVNVWTSKAAGAAHEGLIGSMSVRCGCGSAWSEHNQQRSALRRPPQVTLSSCRVFRFGQSWFPGQQHSPCAPSFRAAIPPGSSILPRPAPRQQPSAPGCRVL